MVEDHSWTIVKSKSNAERKSTDMSINRRFPDESVSFLEKDAV